MIKKVEPVAPVQPDTQIICPHCTTLIEGMSFFCPICGKKVRDKPLSTGFFSQMGLYLASVLLPPLFLGWTIRYLKSSDTKERQIGLISLGLTIAALISGIWFSLVFFKNLTKEVNIQIRQYQDMGF